MQKIHYNYFLVSLFFLFRRLFASSTVFKSELFWPKNRWNCLHRLSNGHWKRHLRDEMHDKDLVGHNDGSIIVSSINQLTRPSHNCDRLMFDHGLHMRNKGRSHTLRVVVNCVSLSNRSTSSNDLVALAINTIQLDRCINSFWTLSQTFINVD